MTVSSKDSSTSTTTSTSKRKHSTASLEEDQDITSPKRQQTTQKEAPPLVALPPPLMQYPNGQFVSVVQQPYYHMYHPQQPIYFPVSPQQHPFMNSPILAPQGKSTTPRLLPKTSSETSPLASPVYPQQQQTPLSPFYHPYTLQQMSPALMPSPYTTAAAVSRHNSISSSPGLGPSMIPPTATTTTADQREKARKVSHSAIERRRRERINDKIFQLKQLIPSCVEQDNLHKMSILQSAIDYIAYLKDIVKKLDEKSGGTSDQLLKGDHLKVKTAKSMLPKEVEPFTNQFSVHPTKQVVLLEEEQDVGSTIATERRSTEHKQRGLKPMDVIKSGTPIVSTGTTPLTPPQESIISRSESISTTAATEAATTTTTTSPTSYEETKHMSLQNILC
jgi:hypothetical protein